MAKTLTVTEYLTALDPPLRDIGLKMRELIDAALPAATAAVWHGHPVWGAGNTPGKAPVCLLKAYPSYLTFGIFRGQAITDPSGRLKPGAREMASIQLRTVADIDATLMTIWLHQVRDLEA